MPKVKETTDPKVDEVLKLFKASKQFRQPLETRWLNFYKAYRAYLDQQQEGINRSNLFIPYAFQTVETIIPRMVASKPKLIALPREESDKDNAELNQALLDYDWDQGMMEPETETFVRAGLIYGTAPIKVTWESDRQMPIARYVDILDYYPDPTARTPESMQFAIHRAMRTRAEIKKTYNMDLPDGIEGDPERAIEMRDSVLGIDMPKMPQKNGKIEILECWWPDRVVCIAARKYVVRDEENIYGWIPFDTFRDYVVPNELYGIGEIEHINRLQQEANSLRNQIMDNNNLIINSMWKRKRGSQVNPRNLVSRPGGIIDVGQMDDIDAVVQPPLPNYVWNLQEVIKGDIQQTTGVTDYQMGGDSGNKGTGLNDTATGISLIQEAGNMRFRLKLRHLEETLRNIATKYLSMNQRFLKKETVVRIAGVMGQRWETIEDFTDLRGNYDLVTEAGSTQPFDPAAEAQKFMAYLKALGEVGVLQDIPKKMLLQLLSDKFDVKEKDQITQAFDEQQQMMQQQAAEQQAQQQAQPQQASGPALDHIRSLPPEQQQQILQSLPPDQQQKLAGALSG